MKHKRTSFPRWEAGILLVSVAAILIGIWLQWLRPDVVIDRSLTNPSSPASTQVAPKSSVAPKATLQPTSPLNRCSKGQGKVVPVRLSVPGLRVRDVQSLAPVADGTAPAPTGLNPDVFAWDKSSAKARGHGSVIMTAHTYPGEAGALGNQLIRQLKPGAVLKLTGQSSNTVCYRVVERRFVPLADKTAARSALSKIYEDQSDKLVIYVCDGLRRGPGDWSARTVWFATPVK